MQKIVAFIVACYLGLLLYFPNSAWGLARGVEVFNLYGRGSGVLPMPIMNITLYLVYIAAVIFFREQNNSYKSFNIKYYFIGFNCLFFMFVFFGAIAGIPYEKIISSKGLINVFNMYLFMLVFIKIVSTENKLDKLADIIVFCALTRGIWGLVRWAFMGGDPANIYANVEKIAVRLTFFDINDNLVATLGAFIAAWILLYSKSRLSASRKLFYYMMIGVGLAVVLLSYRRTAWGGLVLAGFWFVWQQPWRRRIQVGLIVGLIGTLALPVLINERFATINNSRGTTGLFYDIASKKGGIETKEGRFSELSAAWDYIAESPFTGVMPWGGMGPGGAHDFVHSGLFHLWLKGGIFAVLSFCFILGGYCLFTIKVRRFIPPAERGLSEAAFAGFLFQMPTILFGTPFIEFRTSLLLGLLFVLPYLVYGIKKAEDAPKPMPYALKPHFKPVPQPNS